MKDEGFVRSARVGSGTGQRAKLICAFLSLSLATAFVLVPAASAQNMVVIDDFTAAQATISLTSPAGDGTSTSSSVAGGMVGGERDLIISLVSAGLAGNGVSAFVGSTLFNYSQDPSVVASGAIQWDGADGSDMLDPSGLGGVDLTNTGLQDAIQIDVFFDDTPIDLDLEIFTDAGNSSTVALSVPGLIFVPTSYIVPYSALATNLGVGADLTDVGAVTLSFSSLAAPDLILSQVKTTSLVTTTKADALLVDTNFDGLANPGDTIRYTVVIDNPDDAFDADAMGVLYSSSVDANTSLVVGSVTTSQGTVTTGNTGGDTSVAVDVGTITDAGSVTITYDVLIDSPLAAGITELACQGLVITDTLPTGIPTDDPDDPTTMDTDPTLTPVFQPSIETDKSDAILVDGGTMGILNPGDTLRYTAVVSNTGNADASMVMFASSVDANTTLVVGSVTTSQGTVTTGNTVGDTSVLVDAGTIAPMGMVTITYDVTLDDPLPMGVTQIACQGTVTGSNFTTEPTNDPDTVPDDDPTLTPVSADPLIETDKSDAIVVDGGTPGTLNPGDTLRYTAVINNTGTGNADMVMFSSAVDANTTLVVGSVTTSQGTVTTGNTAGDTSVLVDVGTLAVSDSVTVTYDVTLNSPLPLGVTEIACQGMVSGSNFTTEPTNDPDTTPDDDPTLTPVAAMPVIEADKADALVNDVNMDSGAGPGDTVKYTVTITNTGDQDADMATYTSPLDANTTLVVGSVTSTQGTVTSGNTAGDTSVAVDLGTVAVGASITICYEVMLADPFPDGVANIACQGMVSGNNFTAEPTNDPDTGPDDDPTLTPVVRPTLAASKTSTITMDGNMNGVANPGDVIKYTVTISNTGVGGADAVVFDSTVDPNTTLNVGSVTTTAGTVTTGNTGGDTTVSVAVGNIAPAGSVTICFEVTVNDPLPMGVTELLCQGTVSASNSPMVPTDDPNFPGGTDPTLTPAGGEPVIEADKADSVAVDVDMDGLVDAGDTVKYTVTITNTGPVDAMDTTYTSPVDPNTSLVVGSVTTTQGTVTTGNGVGDGSVAIDLGTLAAGASVTICYEATVNTPIPMGLTSIACQGMVSGSNFTTEPTNDPDTTPDDDDPTLTPLDRDPLIRSLKSSSLIADPDGSGNITAGDTLEYAVVIINDGNEDAMAVVFDDIPDPNTALVAGTVTTTQGTVLVGNTAGDTMISVDVGDIPGGGGMVTITFQVTVNDPLPDGVDELLNQGTTTGSNFPPDLTDDPTEPGDTDPTADPIGSDPLVIPTLGEWGLLAMLLALAGLGVRRLRA